MHLALLSSMSFRISSSFKASKPVGSSGLARRANSRSMLTARSFSLMIGVYAPGMGTQSETCGCCSNFFRNAVKKASLDTWGGAMHKVSMSLPGCTTPSL
eukprot:Skav207581  [mRNA]  locus=scaffold2931:142803:149683:- [translate_table: standard]